MSVRSAQQILKNIDREPGYCFPLALDSVMPNVELPREFYDLFYEDYHRENPSYNRCVSLLLDEFFKVKPEPATELAAIAKFNVFGASPQPYMPNVTEDDYAERKIRMQKFGITEKQLRLQELLTTATKNGCSILFSNFLTEGEHVSSLEVTGPDSDGSFDYYIIRDWSRIASKRIYSSSDLAGISQKLGQPGDEYTPLPERSRSVFPEGQTSWELIILPPEPSL